ncbi:hypothetical protein MIR68_001902 [Amoeboaphelidium protococcarum]|nr:hypothetical protein MIR68_001902 [Amoeboaphelidium protococcarum]KAI3642999.1 hypothetical protein MP228_012554 [Amoeboaphelidium protococcarum]
MTNEQVQFKAYACHGKGKPLEPFSYKPRPLGPNDIEIEICYCGICYSDIHAIDSGWGPTKYPVVVGHEISGVVKAVGENAGKYRKVGQRVGVGAQVWSCCDESCLYCNSKTNENQLCPRRVFTYNAVYEDGGVAYGGYAEAVRVDYRFSLVVPDKLKSDVVAPLLCAGTTVFSPLKRFGCGAGKRVGVVGIGGLGHLAVQFASKMGADVVCVSHSENKREECKKLGGTGFLNIQDESAVKENAQKLDILIVTSNHKGQPWDTYFSLMRPNSTVVLLGIPEEDLKFRAGALCMNQIALTGSLIGSPAMIQEMLEFAAEHDVHPWIEKMDLKEANKAIERVRKGDVRYRIVLDTKKF